MDESRMVKLTSQLISSTQDYLKRCLAPVGQRIKALEAWRQDPADIRSMVGEQTQKLNERLAALEAWKSNPSDIFALIESHAVKVWPGLVDQQIEARTEVIAVKASLLVPAGRDGLPGRPGTPGEDGFSPDDFEMKLKPDGRTVELAMRCGERVVTKSIKLEGYPIYKGIYQSSKVYGKDDAITYGGSIWRALKATTEPPKGKSDCWQLVVKGGR
jgi:hypothetical protein